MESVTEYVAPKSQYLRIQKLSYWYFQFVDEWGILATGDAASHEDYLKRIPKNLQVSIL